MAKRKLALGLDIGSSSVKVAQLKETKRGYSLVAFPTRGPALDEKGQRARATRIGLARQTPLLAGRVEADGPYGWRGESATLALRIEHGFGLHRWLGEGKAHYAVSKEAEALAAFLREGLVRPPRRPANESALAGKEIYESPTTGCTEYCADSLLLSA